MSFGFLIPIIDNGRKHSCIGSHYGRIKDKFDILMLMWRDFNFFRINVKGKLFNRIGSLFLSLEFDCARYFVVIFNLYFFLQALCRHRGNKSAKIENSFINVEHIGFNHCLNTIGLLLILHYQLFLEYFLKIVGVNARNA